MAHIELITDSQYKDLTIRYGKVDSPFGKLLIGATPRGICYAGFDTADTFADMSRRYPQAVFTEGVSEDCLRHIDGFMRGSECNATFHIKGTPFQIKVWQALTEIPHNHRSSYADIARKIGHPKATRAVGSAIGRNPVSLLIPCHRVLRSDGQAGGYYWGVDLKQRVLEWENKKS